MNRASCSGSQTVVSCAVCEQRQSIVAWHDDARLQSQRTRTEARMQRHDERIQQIAQAIPPDLLRYLSHVNLADWLTRRGIPTSPRTMSQAMNRADEQGSLLWRGNQAALDLTQGDPNAV